MNQLIELKTFILPPPSENDRRALDQRIRDAVGLHTFDIPLAVLRTLPSQIGINGELSCVIAKTGDTFVLIESGLGRSYSIALDLGTTNLVALLYDNVLRKDVMTRSCENPQIHYGGDILTRLQSAMSGRREEVYTALITGVNNLIRSICEEAGIGINDVHGISVAGNTVMSHFFLGLDISTIPVDPFVPVVRTPGFFTAADLGIEIHRRGTVYVFPNAGSYVGGDITAGILASGMHQADRTSLLIDAGTNAEVVIGNREWMIVGAGAAGPALEEGITRIGRRAKRGVIYDVHIDGETVSCSTFDTHRPKGICGSGMVSLLYELHRAGIIDQTGTLADGPHVAEAAGEKVFTLSCNGAEELFVTQGEIRNFLKSKAAMFTLLLVLTRSVGISFRDVENVYVCGALGTGIDAAKVVGIGMLPAWPAGIVKSLGNSSLAGARMLITNGDLVDAINGIASRITYKHMHDDPEFMKEFMGAVFIPHTNPELLKV